LLADAGQLPPDGRGLRRQFRGLCVQPGQQGLAQGGELGGLAVAACLLAGQAGGETLFQVGRQRGQVRRGSRRQVRQSQVQFVEVRGLRRQAFVDLRPQHGHGALHQGADLDAGFRRRRRRGDGDFGARRQRGEQRFQRLGGGRLGHGVEGAGLPRLLDETRLVVAADDDDGNVAHGRAGLDAAGHLEAVHVRHHVVHENQVGRLPRQHVQGLRPRFGEFHPDAHSFQFSLHGEASDLGIVHHECAQVLHRVPSSGNRSLNVTTEPARGLQADVRSGCPHRLHGDILRRRVPAPVRPAR